MPHTSHAILLATLVVASCSDHDSAAAEVSVAGASARGALAAHAPHRVIVIPKGTSHEFWKAVELGAHRADMDFDDIEVIWQGPSGEGATKQQIALVEGCAGGGYDALCIAPLDSRALVPAVRAALQRGIPVVVFDSALSANDLSITTYVASENRRGGEQAGQELAHALHDHGNVIVLRYQMGSASTTEREEGCLAALADHPGIHVVSSDVYAGATEGAAVPIAENLLSTFQGRVDGVFCPNESSTSGFLTALQRHPRTGRDAIVVVGFDLSTRIVQAIESGALTATIAQDPVAMGYHAVAAARAALAHEPVVARIDTPQTVVTRENLDTPDVLRLLEPFQPSRCANQRSLNQRCQDQK